MTKGGYISDQSCPSDPSHGDTYGMASGEHYCPHHDHDFPTQSQKFWSDDEWETIKSIEPIPAQIERKPKKNRSKPEAKR